MNDEVVSAEFSGAREPVYTEMPASDEAVSGELPETHESSSGEMSLAYIRRMVGLLERIVACMERAPWMVESAELPASREPVFPEMPVHHEAVHSELPAEDESVYPTWILTDSMVAHLERAIEAEQRVRGGAYGG